MAAEAESIMAGVGLGHRRHETASALPYGEQRLVELAVALAAQPRLLLLDEPSAGMTRDETRRLMDDLLEARRRLGRLTIVLIEHEMSVIERVTDRCVVLNYGKKIAEGAYRQVAEDPLVRQAYLGLS